MLCKNRQEAAEIANRIAPEHLGLMIDNPYELLEEIKNFGAVFVGIILLKPWATMSPALRTFYPRRVLLGTHLLWGL